MKDLDTIRKTLAKSFFQFKFEAQRLIIQAKKEKYQDLDQNDQILRLCMMLGIDQSRKPRNNSGLISTLQSICQTEAVKTFKIMFF